MLTHWDPFADITKFQSPWGREQSRSFRPSVDIYEDDKGVHVDAELPGVDPKEIKVSVDNNVLTIKGERKLEHDDKDKGYRRLERFHGSFERSFTLSDDLDAENINADYDKGVLKLVLARKASTTPREIKVNH